MLRRESNPRVVVVLVLALGLAVAFAAARIFAAASGVAGTNRVAPAVFAVSLPSGGLVCQPVAPTPADAAAAVITLGSYGGPIPAARLSLLSGTGAVSATGRIPAGTPSGPTAIALSRPAHPPPASRFCLRFAGRTHVVVAGGAAAAGPGTAAVDGTPQPGVIAITYQRRAGETWWGLLPTLFRRFGYGKAAFFGAWTLPACIAALAAIWLLTARLLARELR
jgi:hypothetical protein